MNHRESNILIIAKKYFDLYYFLSKQDIKSRFRRSYLGIGWLIIQQLMFAICASIVWSKMFGIDVRSFIPFLVIGIVIWGFITASLIDSCAIFVNARSYLKQFPIPQSIFILRYFLTNIYYLAIGILTAFVIFIFFGKLKLLGVIYSLPGLLILLIYFYAASGTMAYIGLRYRDFQHALNGIVSLLFIVTPVIFPPEILIKKGVGMIVYINPFASLIDVVRYPIINGELAGLKQYAIAAGYTLVLFIVQLFLAKRWGRFVPFWV